MGLDLRWLPFKRLSARWSNPVYIKAGRKFWVQGTACSECSGPRKRQMPQPLTQCQGQISQLSPDLRSMLGRLNLWLPRNGRFDRGKTGRHLAACPVLVRCRIGLNRPERKHPPLRRSKNRHISGVVCFGELVGEVLGKGTKRRLFNTIPVWC